MVAYAVVCALIWVESSNFSSTETRRRCVPEQSSGCVVTVAKCLIVFLNSRAQVAAASKAPKAVKFMRKEMSILTKCIFGDKSILQESEVGRAFDAIVIETTGVALPGPIVQLFFADPQVRRQATLDAVVTVVDAKHVHEHLQVAPPQTPPSSSSSSEQLPVGEVVVVGRDEVREQIACADRIVVNKCDLLQPAAEGSSTATSLTSVCAIAQSLNPAATVLTSTMGKLQVSQLLGLKAFDLKCQVIPEQLPPGPGSAMKAQADANNTANAQGTIGVDGTFQSSMFSAAHKSNVETFTLTEKDRPVDIDKFNAWLPEFLQEHGGGLYRMKGFLWVHGQKHKLVCQGVHMTFTGERGVEWAKDETKHSFLVFIGKTPLPRAIIKREYDKCLI